jgi:hypothetical protein
VEFCRGKDERPEMARTVRGLLPGARISGYISLGVSICSRPIGEVLRCLLERVRRPHVGNQRSPCINPADSPT